MKLRQVLENIAPGADEPDAGHGWAIPGPDRTLIDLQKGRTAPRVPESLRMSFLDFNKPGTDGYAAAIEGLHLMKLVAHRRGGDTDFYDALHGPAMPGPMVWMYLPLNPGETVREIWTTRLFWNFVALLVRIHLLYLARRELVPVPNTVLYSFTLTMSERSFSGTFTWTMARDSNSATFVP